MEFLAGLVLTERTAPATQILDFCQHAIKRGLPILHTQLNTLETAQRLADFGNEIPVDDTERAEQVTRLFRVISIPNGSNSSQW
jgi:phosphate acetyltransferase